MPSVPRRLLPLLLTAAALIATTMGGSRSADAGTGGTLLYVDGAGGCAGLTPCLTTIQQAVRLVVAEDSEVRVFPGTYNESVDLNQAAADTGGTYGDLAIVSVDSKGSETAGAVVNGGAESAFLTGTAFDADIRIDGFTVMASASDGILLVADGNITVEDVTATDISNGSSPDVTGDDGVDLRSTLGNILVERVYVNQSQPAGAAFADGLELKAPEGNVTVRGVQATGNGGPEDNDGIDIYDVGGNVLVENSIANFNGDQGISVEAGGNVTVRSSGAEGNGNDGLYVSNNGVVTVEFFGARTNTGEGVQIISLDRVNISDSFFLNNRGSGILASTVTAVLIERVSVVDNNLPLIRAGGQGNRGAIEIRRDLGSVNPSVDSVVISGSRIESNGGDGILLSGVQDNGPVTITSNAICLNSGAGLTNLDETIPIATNNWWGDPSGPDHPDNPNGTGEEVLDESSEVTPWVEFVEGSVTNPPASIGQPKAIEFRFRGADNAALEQGLGWPSSFEAVTDNGVLSSEVPGSTPGSSVPGQIIDEVLAVDLTAAKEGNANIDLKGPCGLNGDFDVAVGSGNPFGDVDCNGSVDTVDALKINRHVAGLEVTQTEPCTDIGASVGRVAPAGGPAIFGDLNCDGSVTPVDALAVLRHVASLPPLSVPKGCPDIGI